MNDDEIESELETIVEGTDKDLSWAWETYYDKLEKAKEAANGLSEETLQEHALQTTKNDIYQGSRTSFGETKDINILSIGHGGVRRWNDRDNGGEKDVLISYGVVQPGKDEDGNDLPMGVGVFICDETDGVDIGNLRSAFGETLANLTGYFTVQKSEELTIGGDTPVYVCNSSDKTRVEPEGSEMDQQEKREFLHNYISEEATIANIHQHLSATNDDGYPAEFGADIKRMNATVIDFHKGDGFNTYTLLDDSVVDPDELGADIVSDQARSPGLTAWVPDEFHQWGVNSQLEVYGTLSRNDDGQITINVCGVIPLIPMEMEEPEQESESETDMSTTESRI